MSSNIVNKGRTVVKEQPLLCLQTIDSQKTSLCCAHCLAYIGDSDIHSTMIAGTNDVIDVTSSKYQHREKCIQRACNANQAFCCTSENCSEVYCTVNCRQYSLWSNHALECAGHSEDMDNTMGEFRTHAYKTEEIFLAASRVITSLIMLLVRRSLESHSDLDTTFLHHTDTVQSVRDILDGLGSQEKDAIESLKKDAIETVCWYGKHFGHIPPLGGAVSGDGNGHSNASEYLLSEPACESWLLLHSALVNSGVSSAVFGPLLSQSFFGTVHQSLERHLHSLQMTANPLPQTLIKLLSSQHFDSQGSEEALLRKLLTKRTGVFASDLAATDKLLLISELNALATGTGGIAAAAAIAGPDDSSGDTTPTIFNFDGRACHSVCMVLLPNCSKRCAHSCNPNVQLSAATAFDRNDETDDDCDAIQVDLPFTSTFLDHISARGVPCVELVALRTFNPQDEGYALSYVDDSIISANHSEYTYQSRQDQLAARFKLSSTGVDAQRCVCLRCRFEVAQMHGADDKLETQNVINSSEPTDVLHLGHNSMQQSMYDDAKFLYTSLLNRLLGENCRLVLCTIRESGSLPDLTTTRFPLTSVEGSVSTGDCSDKSTWGLVADTFHALGAAYLESGDWRRSHLVWRFGLLVCPEHARSQLQSEVTKIDCYPCAEICVQRPPCVSDAAALSRYMPYVVSKQGTRRALSCVEYAAPKLDIDFSLTHLQSEESKLHPIGTNLVPFAVVSSGETVDQRVFLTSAQQPLLSASECQYVIDASESFAAQAGGWSTSRHYAVPTTDIPVHVVKSTRSIGGAVVEDSLLDWFRGIFLHRLAPLLAVQFQDMFNIEGPVTVAIHDAFVVKYDTGTPVNSAAPAESSTAYVGSDASSKDATMTSPLQTYLPLHCDQSSHSFTIALNGAGEYEGGGTYFPSLGAVMRPDAGQVLSFPGGTILHGGEPIVRGTRYILAVFAYIAGAPVATKASSPADSSVNFDQMLSGRGYGDVSEVEKLSNKRARVETTGFKDVCWKSQPSDRNKGDEDETPSPHLFSFSF